MTERELFVAALHLRDAARVAFLDLACDDRTVRARVESLLLEHERLGGFLEPSAAPGEAALDPNATTNLPGNLLGTVIAGKYKLMELIGEGGMGSVWRAQQTEPVKRFVAVKLIKSGMDSKAVLARFEAERQALAVMDHPNIARILDGGVTEAGSPFFVMELVKGVPITEFCDARKLTPKQRLELFVPVCQAIQHAHQKGVIHRDIKPSNVLIALYDDKAVPKVIDFGIAKATGQALTDSSYQTAFGGVVGTPEYMSPEQASLNNLDIDTRSDVYSLGVLLYELLAGSPPFQSTELKKAGMLEMLRVVREEEPPRPSTRLSTANTLPSISANRGTEPKKLTGLLRNELDWIVMKALEKDRARRYESANGFAADVQRYLAGEAVQAHPPSAGYRMRKFIRRHKGRVLAASLVLLAIIVGVLGTTCGLIEARQQRNAADLNRREAEKIAQRERTARKHALEAVRDITNYVADRNMTTFQAIEGGWSVKGGDVQELFDSPLTPAEKDLLNKLLIYYESAAHDFAGAADDPTVLAGAYSQIGRIRKTYKEYALALVAYHAALVIREELARNEPSSPENIELLIQAHRNLAETLKGLGRDGEAVSHWDSVIRLSPPENRLELRMSRAAVLARAGRTAEAAAECDSVLSESAPLELCYYNAACVYALASANSQTHHEEYARGGVALLRRALKKGEFTSIRPTIAIAYLKLDPDLAPLRGREDFQRVAAAAFIKILTDNNAGTQVWVSNAEPLARNLLRFSTEDAEPILRECLEIRLRNEPEAWTTFNTKSLLGGSLLGQKKYAEAEPLLLAGYDGMKQREAQIPMKDKGRLTDSLERLVQFYNAWGKKDKAEEWRKKSEAAKVGVQPSATP